ncbi:hypothetical protein EMCRGX_G008681 [Ephydatia muelleri]
MPEFYLRRVFHVNMLKTFSVRTAPEVCSYAEEDVDQDDISVWKEASTKKADFGDQLSGQERGRLDKLLECYQTVFSDTPGLTRLAENRIPTVENNAVRLPPYRLPHAYRVLVRKELPTIYTLLLLYRSPIDRLDEEVDPEHRNKNGRGRSLRAVTSCKSIEHILSVVKKNCSTQVLRSQSSFYIHSNVANNLPSQSDALTWIQQYNKVSSS